MRAQRIINSLRRQRLREPDSVRKRVREGCMALRVTSAAAASKRDGD